LSAQRKRGVLTTNEKIYSNININNIFNQSSKERVKADMVTGTEEMTTFNERLKKNK
jgi:hypothetical protein